MENELQPDPRQDRFAFTINPDELQAVVLRNGALSVFTVGFWRFWMKTRLRRLIWRETRIGEDGFEYTGDALELLIGTLIAATALAFLIGGVNVALMFADLAIWQSGAFSIGGLVSLVLFLPLFQFAVYRARRYRLLRTRWRGIRFGMDGSGAGFVKVWLAMAGLTVLSLGLFYPFLRVARERYMTDHMMFGDARFRFEGSARTIFPYWLTLWFSLIVPPAALFGFAYLSAGAERSTSVASYVLLVFITFYVWFWLYSRYRAAELRLFMSARRVRDVRINCAFRPSGLIGPFWAMFGRSLIPGIPVLLLIALLTALALRIAFLIDGDVEEFHWQIEQVVFANFHSTAAIAVFLIALWINYGLSILYYMWLWQVVYFRRVHTHLCATTTVTGLESLDDVRQRIAEDQAESEGFADALDVGGL